MKDYTVDKLRNVCLMGHGGSGKTTLTEAMLYNTGVLDRFGKVPDGTTVSDFDAEEIKRGFSINTSIAPYEWNNHKINIIDTPGYFDFVGEVLAGLRVADSAIILVPAKDGVAVGTEKAWGLAEEKKMPRMFLMSKLDEENADFSKTLAQLKDTFGNKVVAFQLPIIENEKFTGIVDIVTLKAKRFEKDKIIDIDIPDSLSGEVDTIRESLMEAIAETSEELMDKFFEGEAFTNEEISKGLLNGVSDGSLVPVYCSAALHNEGVKLLMDAIVSILPSPKDTIPEKAVKEGSDEEIEINADPNGKLSAIIFKTIADPFVGKISLFKVISGTMKADSLPYNTRLEKTEKLSQLFTLVGKKQINLNKVVAGDIGAVAKLANSNTNDTLCDAGLKASLKSIVFPEPNLSLAVEPLSKGDEEKISSGLQKLLDEDPTFKVENNPETRQTLVSGIGEQHIDVIVSKLKAKFGVSVTLTEPKVPYRETVKGKVKVEGKHKKQSGGHGQYGHVWIEFEPGETEDLTFEEKVFGGSVPKNYFPAVEKGLRESIKKGVLAGFPVVNLKATLLDGSFHPVDSSEMAFKIAASVAYKKGCEQAKPVLLEPIYKMDIYITDNYMGDVIGDINKKRGRILGMSPMPNGLQKVEAEAPLGEIFKYAIDLRSMTQGRGWFTKEFVRYEDLPGNLAEKVIADTKKEDE
jgi:elongation factor G